jgi:glucan biosynthesis protein
LSAFVESTSEWGEGTVRLMQLPATNEYNDNAGSLAAARVRWPAMNWCSNIGCAGLREIE